MNFKLTILGTLVGQAALAAVPEYSVSVIAPIPAGGAFLTRASDAGHVVGWTVDVGIVRGFVATAADGVRVLPLPPGYMSSTALAVNTHGVVVGAVDDGGLPYDGGEPAVWLPDGSGGYDVVIPEQFTSIDSPLGGSLAVNGGMAVDINDDGTIVGWSRFQGFQGGPATRFYLDQPPVDLRDFGFDATPRDLNENNVIVGDSLRLDLNTGQVTDIGTPPPADISFNFAIGYAINDHNEVVAAARRATSTNNVWSTYLHNDAEGWSPLNPAQIATRFVGFYDNNNLGDVSATGGVLFGPEDVLVSSFDALLAPGSQHWDTVLGFIANDRTVYTTATNTLNSQIAIVALVPNPGPCPADFAAPFGTLDIDDVLAFLDAYAMGDPSADLATGGGLNIDDVLAFLDAFAAGCP